MKALLVSALYHPNVVGGAEKVARLVAEGLLAHGHESVVVTTHDGPRDTVADVNGVRVHYLGLRNVYWPHDRRERSVPAKAAWHAIDSYNPLMARAVAKVLDAERPDVVHTHSLTGFSCAVWPVVKARALPLVHTLHDYSLLCPKTSMFKAGRNCEAPCTTCTAYRAPARRLSANVDRVVGVSRYTLERHLAANYFPRASDARVIHNGLPVRSCAERAPQPPGGPLRLGFVGQLVPSKGIEELVRAMAAWEAGDCELRVAGRGSAAYEAELRSQSPANVRFLGFVDPETVYREIDVLVVPSQWQEPLGMTVLEAAMHGVPAIVARRGGLPEIVEAGRTGLVYEPCEPGALQAAVDVFLRNRALLESMQPQVLDKARSFGVESMQREYVALLETARLDLIARRHEVGGVHATD